MRVSSPIIDLKIPHLRAFSHETRAKKKKSIFSAPIKIKRELANMTTLGIFFHFT